MMLIRNITVLVAIAIIVMSVLFIRNKTIHLPGVNQGYAPEQPIDFSHRLHSGDLEMDCLYCHTAAEKSSVASIPSPSVCMNCHRFVTAKYDKVKLEEKRAQEEDRDLQPVISGEIRELYAAVGFDTETMGYRPSAKIDTLKWVRVHNLPDYVFFDHSRHVNAGVDCSRCHGPVETMETVYQFSDMTMGWCVNCHRDVQKDRVAGLENTNPSISCTVCHY